MKTKSRTRDYSKYTELVVERKGEVLRVTMNRPDTKNAFTAEMHTQFSNLFHEIRSDDVRVVVLTGAGDYFSIAADLDWYGGIDSDEWLRLMREAKWIVQDMLALPQPLVVAMNGDAMGLGSSLVSMADFVIAAQGARLGDHHAGMGLVCGDGGAMTYPFSMGMQRAKEFFMLGREFGVEELHAMGVVTRVVPRAQLEAEVDDVVASLLKVPKEALEWTKATLNRMVNFSSFLGTDYALGHEGWSWYLEPSQSFLASQRAKKRTPRG